MRKAPRQSTTVTEAMRQSLRSKVAHAAEILHSQGPISTFIHTNPLHNLEHLPFDQAVHEAERLLGGHGYLPNEEYRRLYRAGRITEEDLEAALGADQEPGERVPVTTLYGRQIVDRDVRRLHLLYGVEPLDPAALPVQVFQGCATARFRDDVPEETRRRIVGQSMTDLRLSLDRVGREWTLVQWVDAHTNLDLLGHLRGELCHEIRSGELDAWQSLARERRTARVIKLLDQLEIPSDRRAGYLRCIQHQLFNVGVYATERLQELCVLWLEIERRLLRRIVPCVIGCKGTFDDIQRSFTENPEAYVVQALWYAALASRGLDDPLSGISNVSLMPESPTDRNARLFARVSAVLETEQGLPIPLTSNLRDAIEREVTWVGRQSGRRQAILAALGQGWASEDLLLTFAQAIREWSSSLPRRITLSGPLLRLLLEVRHRGGFTWALWEEVRRLPLAVAGRRMDDHPWDEALQDGLRVRITDDVRALLHDEYAVPRAGATAEARRTVLLEGLQNDGLTLAAWEALQADLADWAQAPADEAAAEEERLCRRVLAGFRPTELGRPAYAALEELIALRGKAGPRAKLLAGLRQLDPYHQLVLAVHKSLADEMANLGHDLTLSDFLRRMTGLDLNGHVNQYMIRWCAAFLDEGLAAWPMPDRGRGFYGAWKRLAETDVSFWFLGVRGWRDALRALPERPDDALIHSLQVLGIAEEHWSEYLARRLVQLPGWAGLIKWREQRPHYPRQQEQPIDVMQYLAVRLFCESMLIRSVCRRTWGIEGTVRHLHHYLREHPGEFLVRHELVRGGLPQDLRRRAMALLHQRPDRADQRAWFRLAAEIWAYRQEEGPGHNTIHTVCRNAWRLFHLAQFLGLSAGELRALSVVETDRWLAVLDAFPSSDHGPIWLRAYERHYQSRLLASVGENCRRIAPALERPRAQFVLCIDEREESFRRHIEAQDPTYETFGTAGFFGVAMQYSALEQERTLPLCPVMATPVHRVLEIAAPDCAAQTRRFARRNRWLTFFDNLYSTLKANLITSYFLIDITGFLLGGLLFGKILFPRRLAKSLEALHRTAVRPPKTTLLLDADSAEADRPPGASRQGFSIEEQAGIVEGQLRIMGLTRRFARLVFFIGHGSTSDNNPHESAYDCGACGGKHGGPNARALAGMANKPEVRFALRHRGIAIPADTFFLGAMHNTASDAMTYFDTDRIPFTHRHEFERIVRDLDVARALNAQERCRLLPMAPKRASPTRSLRHVERRSVDFTQVNPEWGHATNASVVVGRRELTKGLFLDRRTFLQSYDPAKDSDGVMLERILSAVVPVAAGIGLEYYFSRVDNRRYGCGTKVPHNITGLVGLMDGTQSDLRTGLPWQMVWVHEPLRLTFVAEANPRLVNAIVQRHRALQKLFDHQWAHLVVLDFRSGEFLRYEPKGQWEQVPGREPAYPQPRSLSNW